MGLAEEAVSPPRARAGDVVDNLHGEQVPDPYRWLEDSADPETKSWVTAQHAFTESVLATAPGREEIRAQLTQRWDYPRSGVPFEPGGRWFQARNAGLQNQPVWYVMDGPGAEGRVLIDPNELAPDGTAAVSAVKVSPDGSLAAYAIARAGSDWLTWHVRDVESGADLGDALEWCKSPEAEWAKDGSGFYYPAMKPPQPGQEYQQASRDRRVCFHRPGSAQRDDEVVFAPDDPELYPSVKVTADGRYLVLTISRGISPGAEVRVLELAQPDAGWRILLPGEGVLAEVVAAEGSTFYVLTDDHADRRRIVAVGLEQPQRSRWREVIPAGEDTLLEAHHFGGRLVCHYLRDACSLLRVSELDGTAVRDIPVPDLSTLAGGQVGHDGIEGSAESDLVLFQTVSFTEAESLWSHDLRTGETALLRPAPCSLDPARFVTERVSVTSADGTVLPMFVTRRRDLPRDGEAPVLLYAYGGVGICITPSFSVEWAVWVERGGVLAVGCLRGGGEYGRAWHDAGRRANKQNVFDDFCACARWLAGSGWSRPGRIAINGGSNGGLLVGACLTQHPELFGAAVPDVGVLDMLRYDRFTVGFLWRTEYGRPAEPAEYQWLHRYSPLHNVRPARYPPTLIRTGDHDDRVVPAHSFKFAAALQAAQQGDAPVLLRVEESAGHGHGKPVAKEIANATDLIAFLEGWLGTG